MAGDERRVPPGEQHFTDISAVIADLDKRFPAYPDVSDRDEPRNSIAAALGARFGPRLAGVVLTSTMFREPRPVQ